MSYVNFFFGDFWHWLGGMVYLVIVADAVGSVVSRIVYREKPTT